MLYDRIQVKDLDQFFGNSLFMYAGRPVFCKAVNKINELEILDLETQQQFTIVFDPTLCTGITDRIGMVNVPNEGVSWVYRQPSRRFSIGLNRRNTSFVNIGGGDANFHLYKFTSKYFVDAINNRYPSLEEALDMGVTCAFDKQFAVTQDGYVYYRTDIVGKTKKNKVVFDAPYKHLSGLLENVYADNRESLRI